MPRRRLVILALLLLPLAGCSSIPFLSHPAASSTSTAPASASHSTAPAQPTPTQAPAAVPLPITVGQQEVWTHDATPYSSPWYDGPFRIMIPYGCNLDPYYGPAPVHCGTLPSIQRNSVVGAQGYHNGIDILLPCGTIIRAGLAGTILDPHEPGTPGPAYGPYAFRIRVVRGGTPYDVLIAHGDKAFVNPGDTVVVGQKLALSNQHGAPDGCHLHFEVRPAGGRYTDSIPPETFLGIPAADKRPAA